MTTIVITINGEQHEVIETRPVPKPSPIVEPVVVDTVSVPSTDVVYYNNGERKTYCVTRVDGAAVACTCPDFHFRRRCCKHMSAVGTIFDKGEVL